MWCRAMASRRERRAHAAGDQLAGEAVPLLLRAGVGAPIAVDATWGVVGRRQVFATPRAPPRTAAHIRESTGARAGQPDGRPADGGTRCPSESPTRPRSPSRPRSRARRPRSRCLTVRLQFRSPGALCRARCRLHRRDPVEPNDDRDAGCPDSRGPLGHDDEVHSRSTRSPQPPARSGSWSTAPSRRRAGWRCH